MAVKAVPEGHYNVTPYLCIDGAARALDFYKRAFGAVETYRLDAPGGKIGHAEIKIGDSAIMLADPYPGDDLRGPNALGGSSTGMYIYVEDADRLFAQAMAAGATELHPMQDQFYGDRTGSVRDPFGHVWYLATHKEDVPPEEIAKRATKMFAAKAP